MILSFQKTMTEENWADHIQVNVDFPLLLLQGYLLGGYFKVFSISSSGYCSPAILVLHFLSTLEAKL